MSAHKPATPLPWISGVTNDGYCYVTDKTSWPVATVTNLPQNKNESICNAAYIAHAANAYPKLVQALQLIANTPKDATRVPQEITRNRRIAKAVLSELGEYA